MLHNKTNTELYEELNKYVHGHSEAKKALINLVSRSYMRYYQRHGLNKQLDDDLVPNSHVLLVGASGTGKTYLVETLTKVCKLPLIKLNATQLTPVGNKDGDNIRQIVKLINDKATELFEAKLAFSTDGARDRIIVYVDEIDKLAKSFESSGNWNKQIQSTLLALIEGKEPGLDSVSFIFSGAFEGMQEDTPTKHDIGFFSSTSEKDSERDWDRELVKYGLMPELVGRISRVVSLDTLTLDDYKDILRTKIIPKTQKDLRAFGVYLHPNDIDSKEIAEKAFKSGLGIRALHKSIRALVEELEFAYEIPLKELTHEIAAIGEGGSVGISG